MYKVKDSKCVQVFHLHTKFGGGSSSGLALIYDSLDKVKKFEPKFRLKRADLLAGTVWDGLKATHMNIGRRNYKKMKGDLKKVRGKKYTETRNGAGTTLKKRKFH